MYRFPDWPGRWNKQKMSSTVAAVDSDVWREVMVKVTSKEILSRGFSTNYLWALMKLHSMRFLEQHDQRVSLPVELTAVGDDKE